MKRKRNDMSWMLRVTVLEDGKDKIIIERDIYDKESLITIESLLGTSNIKSYSVFHEGKEIMREEGCIYIGDIVEEIMTITDIVLVIHSNEEESYDISLGKLISEGVDVEVAQNQLRKDNLKHGRWIECCEGIDNNIANALNDLYHTLKQDSSENFKSICTSFLERHETVGKQITDNPEISINTIRYLASANVPQPTIDLTSDKEDIEVVTIKKSDLPAIQTLCELGFDQPIAAKAYIKANRDSTKAAELLFKWTSL